MTELVKSSMQILWMSPNNANNSNTRLSSCQLDLDRHEVLIFWGDISLATVADSVNLCLAACKQVLMRIFSIFASFATLSAKAKVVCWQIKVQSFIDENDDAATTDLAVELIADLLFASYIECQSPLSNQPKEWWPLTCLRTRTWEYPRPWPGPVFVAMCFDFVRHFLFRYRIWYASDTTWE